MHLNYVINRASAFCHHSFSHSMIIRPESPSSESSTKSSMSRSDMESMMSYSSTHPIFPSTSSRRLLFHVSDCPVRLRQSLYLIVSQIVYGFNSALPHVATLSLRLNWHSTSLSVADIANVSRVIIDNRGKRCWCCHHHFNISVSRAGDWSIYRSNSFWPESKWATSAMLSWLMIVSSETRGMRTFLDDMIIEDLLFVFVGNAETEDVNSSS